MHFPLHDGIPGPASITAGDLRKGRSCEFGLLVEADVRLGRRAVEEVEPDPVRERFGEMGLEREADITARLNHLQGEGWHDARDLDHPATLQLLADPEARLVHQASVRGERFSGRADHLLRDDDGRWIVAETKLARSAHLHALVQVAAYAEALAADGVTVAPFVRLYLGDDSVVDTPIEEIEQDLVAVRSRVLEVLDTHLREEDPVVWGDPRWRACLRCDACRAEAEEAGDVGLVAGVHASPRRRLVAAGVRTVADLAERTEPVEGIAPEALTAMRSQARLQLTEPTPERPLAYEVHDRAPLRDMPEPSDGDVYFDFEGDPMWRDGSEGEWGLEYLFGCLTTDGGERFTPFWAHDRAEEREALVGFVDWVTQRRRQWPGMHVYHYAGYERTALTRLAARHGVYEDEVAGLLADGVLVDLYAVVKATVRVGSPSYSLKRLEPLYMGDDLRDADGVTAGGDSILEYQRFREARAVGDEALAAERLEDLRRYNEYDCLSTLRLRDWLLSHAGRSEPGRPSI